MAAIPEIFIPAGLEPAGQDPAGIPIAETKFADASNMLQQLTGPSLTDEQTKLAVALKEQIQKALAAKAAENAAGTAGGRKRLPQCASGYKTPWQRANPGLSVHAVSITQEKKIICCTIAIVLLVLWLLGFGSSYTMGGFIHLLHKLEKAVMNKIVFPDLLIGGVALMICGINATNSFGSDVCRFLTGSPTDKAIGMLIGGVVAAGVGLMLTFRIWKQAWAGTAPAA